MNIINLNNEPTTRAAIALKNEKPLSHGWSDKIFPKKMWAITFKQNPSKKVIKAANNSGLYFIRDLNTGISAIALPEISEKYKATKIFNVFAKNYQDLSKKTASIITDYLNQPSFSYKLSNYDKEKLKPGYTGKFFIQYHNAKKAGKHWDLRIEFPVDSLEKALKKYVSKNDKTQYKDKSGTVLRSFIIKKREIPTSENKIYAIETEDHPVSYGDFEGTIEKGYGTGKVNLWDKGTYKLLERDGDKKYVIDFKGNKLKGTYALVKYKKGYLWIKTREKKASAIDYPRPTMFKGLWDIQKNPPILKSSTKTCILFHLFTSLNKYGFNNPMRWVFKIIMTGSATGYNYKEKGDVDVDVLYSIKTLRKYHPEYNNFSDTDLHDYIQKILDTNRDTKVTGSEMTLSFMLLNIEDKVHGDNIYDILSNRWLKQSPKLPLTFDPDKAFKKQKEIADYIVSEIFKLFAEIRVTGRDFYRINQYNHYYGGLRAKKIIAMLKLKFLSLTIVKWRKIIWQLNKDALNKTPPIIYPAYNFSENWDERYIIFNYLARYGMYEPIKRFYEIFKEEPYIDMIKKFINEMT